jgi:hypothetical protein
MPTGKHEGKATATKTRAKAEAGRANQQAERIDRGEEARNLAREAVEEMRHGDRNEGKFLADEAKALDAHAADQVLKQNSGGGA